MLRFQIRRHPRPLWQRLLLTAAFLLLATLARAILHVWIGDRSPYLPFLAAVLAASIWGGVAGGLAASIVGGLVANWAFVGALGFDRAPGDLAVLLVFLALCGFVIVVADTMTKAVRREQAAAERLSVVGRELEHRVKNVLTVAQSVVRQTIRSSQSLEEFEGKVEERLQALAAAQLLLAQTEGRPVELRALVDKVFQPFNVRERLIEPADGPDVHVAPDVAVALALLLNELATNSMKYGALSAQSGKVAFQWVESRDEVAISWREMGGPAVVPPRRSGFGSRLFKSALPDSSGRVDITYEPGGVRCQISVALASAR